MFKKLTILLLLFSFQGLFAQSGAPDLSALDAYIEQARRQWEVPGLSIAIVKDGEVIFAKGYGVRELGRPQPVDEKTIFGICSTTKAMTAAAIGMLVDEGKLDWEDPVVEYLPDFQLFAPYVTRHLRVKDLLTHNAGLGNADFLWYGQDNASEEILYRMRYLEPAYPFRGGYTYQNIMYLAAGALIEEVSGMPWADFLQRRIFDPLGMNNTYPTLKQSLGQINRFTPHHRIDGEISPIPNMEVDPVAPAGAVWSSAEDMAKWTRFVLDSARVDGKRLLSKESYAEWLRPQVIIPEGHFYPSARLTHPNWTTYALGWFQHDYEGRMVHFHTGSMPGTTAIIGLLPEENLGVYYLGNLDHAEVRHALMYKIFDVFTGQPDGRDWSSDLLALYQGFDRAAEKRRKEQESKRVPGTRLSLPLEAYTGTYADPLHGEVNVTLSNDQLSLVLSTQLSLTLDHWHFDTFQGHWNLRWHDPSLVSFELNSEGKVEAIRLGRQHWTKKMP